MADVPSITLSAPSPVSSPSRDPINADLDSRLASARPVTPVSRNGAGKPCDASQSYPGAKLMMEKARPETSGGWTTPSRLIRTISSNTQSSISMQRDDVAVRPDPPVVMDPLSQHILRRTHVPLSIQTSNQRPRTAENGTPLRDDRHAFEQSPAPAVQEPLQRTDTVESAGASAQKDSKKGVKAVAFLSRLIGNKKKEVEEDAVADQSEDSEERPEGNDAEVFAQPFDNMGFNPHHPQPPAYIKVRSKYRKERDFDRMFLAQELSSGIRPAFQRQDTANKLRRKSSAAAPTTPTTPTRSNTVWAMEFSKDGKYLAVAGADTIVRVWAVLSSPDDRQKHERQESSESEANGRHAHSGHLSAPVFQSQPVREYEGHTSTVLDLSWSKNNFLLSSSMDKTVRLWHITRTQCLCTFKHNDFVPSIAFHPKDDRFFLAGSLDSKLRLWSIPDKSVAYSAQMSEMITAVAFTPDGKHAMAGCLGGLCMFYETEGLKYQSQIHVRSTRGPNAKGSKITGIQAQYNQHGEVKLLITSNDSRIRIYNFRDKSLELKLRGNENNCSQIRATLSDDGKYVICGSEDRKAYIWSLDQPTGDRRDRIPVEMFETHDTIATVVCFAPTKTRQHLSKSEDPVYDLCNPPPITLLSHSERAGSQTSSRPPTENGSIQATPTTAEGRFERPKESLGYISRSAHKGGNIIIAADFSGKIKVFRQDCAWSKRKSDDWDRASIFTKRSGRLSRTASMATRASQKSYQESIHSTSTQAPSERIMSWRQGISSTPNFMGRRSSKNTNRSISPRKSLDRRSKQSDSPPHRKTAHPLSTDAMVRTPTPREVVPPLPNGIHEHGPESMRPKHTDENPLALQGNQSYLFWDIKGWKERSHMADRQARHEDQFAGRNGDTAQNGEAGPGDLLAVRPNLTLVPSYVSRLSDEKSSGDEFDEAQPHVDQMICSSCHGKSFTARRNKGGTDLVCTQCGSRPIR